MFELDMFYTDETHTTITDRPNDYKFHNAVADITLDSNNFLTAVNQHYITKMWQWFDAYRVWLRTDQSIPMFDQPIEGNIAEELTTYFRESFKASRSAQVDNIKVTVDSMEFDGDEKSQQRMNTAINAAIDDIETVKWALADNTVANVTRPQLKQALRLAGQAMEAIWFQE
jgi:hypothetical protein